MDISDFSYASLVPSAVVMMARIALATWLFARGLDTRPHALARFAVAFAACVAAYVLILHAYATGAYAAIEGDLSQMSSVGSGYLLVLLLFTAIIAACVGIVLLVYDVSVWVALFCGTAGYTLQNLATGLTDLLDVLQTEAGLDPDAGVLYWVDEWGPFLLVCAVCYLVAVRKIDATGLKRVDDRSMLLMMPVVSLVIVGFDLVVKSMWYSDVELVYVLLLRAVHTAACVFVLWMEYELLYRRHLSEEMRTTERLLEERGRQYEQSREHVQATNLRYHAIREQVHELGERLDAVAAGGDGGGSGDGAISEADETGPGAGSETTGTAPGADLAALRAELRELERSISVYDAVAHTRSEVLDTILTERAMICDGLGVGLTYMADGEALAGLAPGDVYVLVGGILDAAASVAASLDEGRRTVSLSVRRALGGASVHVECPCDAGAAAGLDLAAPREVAERHGGTFLAAEDEGVLAIDVLL